MVTSPPGRFAEKPSEFVPQLAKSWEMSPDARTWTFQLREGVQFHKGYGEMTSEDVVFSIDRARDPKQGGGNRSLYENIAEVKANGKYTVVVTLRQPDPLFIGGTIQDYSCVIMSKKATLEKGENIGRDPIGTGAYEFVSLDPDPSKGIMMTANPKWFGGAPPTKNLHVMYILDTTARTLALLSGTVHMIEGVRAPGWTQSIQQKNPNMQFDVAAPGSLFTMHFNMSRKPLDDVRVRRAFAYAIDRDAIAKAMAPISRRTWGLNAPSFPGGLTADSLPPELRYPFDPAKAKALLAEAGFPNGFSMDAYTSQREDYKSVMLIVQELMRKVGVNINLQVIDHTTFHANNRKDMNTIPQNSSAYPPVPALPLGDNLAKSSEVKPDGSGGTNYSHYGVLIPGIDELLDQAGDEPDFEKRIAIIQKAERKVLEDVPLIPISTNGYLIVRDPKVKLGYEVKSGYAFWPLSKATIS
nr:ABC transporter substrate-binding protein [Alsobacter ponti]